MQWLWFIPAAIGKFVVACVGTLVVMGMVMVAAAKTFLRQLQLDGGLSPLA